MPYCRPESNTVDRSKTLEGLVSGPDSMAAAGKFTGMVTFFKISSWC